MITKIDDHTFQLLKNIELCCREVIMNIKVITATEDMYADPVSNIDEDHGNSFWALLRNNTLCMALLRWNNVFGAYAESTHWHKITWLKKDLVVKEIFRSCGINESVWKMAHSNANDLRNQFIAHNDFTNPAPNAFKKLGIYSCSAKVLRSTVLSIFAEHFSNDSSCKEYIEKIIKVTNNELDAQVENMCVQGIAYANRAIHAKST